MKIPFYKLNRVFDIDIKLDDLKFDGHLVKKSKFANLDGKLSGTLQFVCDVCAQPSKKQINEQLNIKLTNRTLSIEEEDDLDIIECGEIVDIDEIINAEIEAIKSDYLKCANCE